MSNRRIFLLLLAILLINFGAYGLITPFITTFLMSDGNFVIPDSHIGEIAEYAIFGSTMALALSPAYILLGPLLGAYSDIIGRKRALTPCQYLFLFAYFILVLSLALKWLLFILLGALLLSLSLTMFPIIHAVVADICKPEQRAYYYILHPLSLVPMMLMAQVSGYIVEKNMLSSNNKIKFLGMIILGAVFASLQLIECLPETKKPSQVESKPVLSHHLFNGLAAILTNSQARVSLLLLVTTKFALGLYTQQIFYYVVNQFHYSYGQASLLMVQICIAIVVSICIYFVLLRLVKLQSLALSCFCCMGVGMVGCCFAAKGFSYNLFLLLLVFGSAAGLPVLWTLLANSLEQEYQGLMMGIAWPACAIAWSVSGIVTEFANYYSNALPFQIASVVVLLGLIVCWRFNRSNKIKGA